MLQQLLDIFLVVLTSGCLVREISALHRIPNLTYVTPSGHLILKPGPDFLAKTEDPLNKRHPWRISPLPGDSLCPVFTTQSTYNAQPTFSMGNFLTPHLREAIIISCHKVTSYILKKHNLDSIP